jgi:hypothetical protein
MSPFLDISCYHTTACLTVKIGAQLWFARHRIRSLMLVIMAGDAQQKGA